MIKNSEKVTLTLKILDDKNEISEKTVEFYKESKLIDLSALNLVEIPKGLEQFESLRSLWLDKNKLTKIQFLTIDDQPFNINNLQYLISLRLQHNSISKIENIHHFSKLEQFNLFDEYQSENIEESFKISLENFRLEQKQIQKQLLKQKQEKEYFDKHFKEIHQQFINNHQNNDLLI